MKNFIIRNIEHLITIGLLTVIAILITLMVGTANNLVLVKANAQQTFKSAGFELIGYQGYIRSLGGYSFAYSEYGGAKVYYIIERDGIILSAGIKRWGDEYHIYDIEALNAVSN